MRDESSIRTIERAMSRIARSMGRRDLGRQVERSLGSRVEVPVLQAIAAIDELSGPGEAPTIKDIARYLDVHHSRASRLVKDMIRSGLITRLASQEDARKSPLALSDRGQEIAGAIRAARTKFFAARLHGLSRSDRRNLARLLERFADNDAGARHGIAPEADAAQPPAGRKLRTKRRRKSAV